MKKCWKYLIVAAFVLTMVVAVTGCSQWDPPYKSLDEKGYTVSVRFDANGGVFAGTKDVSVVDVFNPADYKTNAEGKAQIPLLTPDNPIRQQKAFVASKTGHFLAGWYTERTPRVNEEGKALDAWGELTSVSGREQGYTYSGKWNFDTDYLEVNAAGTSSSKDTLTLYAAWVPYYNFEFYTLSADGTAQLYETKQLLEIAMPEWDMESGKQELGDVPAKTGFTFEQAYTDTGMTAPIEDTVIRGQIDEEKGISLTPTIKVYTTWTEGTWFRISSAEQFYKNSRLDGCYYLEADLDFDGQFWAPALTTGNFTGKIMGNGHTIKNVTVTQGDNSKGNGGLFGQLTSQAALVDVTFENITYQLHAGYRSNGGSFGLLAGSIGGETTLTNVSVSGVLEIGPACYFPAGSDFSVGLLAGTGTPAGMSHANITCTLSDPDNNPITFTVDEDGDVKLNLVY